MVLASIIAELKKGSVVNVYTRGNLIAYKNGASTQDLLKPYIIVFDDFSVNSYYSTSMSVQPIVVEAHFPVGFIAQLNKYIEEEVITLLHRKRLKYTDNLVDYYFQVYATMYLSIMSEPNDDKSISGGNDDGTISRFRRFFIPRRGL